MKGPTRKDLTRLLFSDPASEAWEGDAHDVLAAGDGDDDALDRVTDLLDMVAGEVGDKYGSLADGEDEVDDLDSIAWSAKRGAILLLHAAWHAEDAAKRLRKVQGA